MAVDKISKDLINYVSVDHKSIAAFLAHPDGHDGLDNLKEKVSGLFNKTKKANHLRLQIEIEKRREEYRLANSNYFELPFMKEFNNQHDFGYMETGFEYMEKKFKEMNKNLRDCENN
jgi:hypothetical protein